MNPVNVNLKSDVRAKHAFIERLVQRGFDEVRVTGSPADVTARRGADIFYFEIKYTAQHEQYFGAATLTEWEAAFAHGERYKFVVAAERDAIWTFHEYTPEEFMAFSSVPPFKIFFNIPVGTEKATQSPRRTKRVQLTRERLTQMVDLFRTFRAK